VFPSWFPSGWLLSPLFHEDVQIFIFPAPLRYLGDPYLPAADGHLRWGWAIVGRVSIAVPCCRHGTIGEMRLPRSEQYPLRSTLPIIDLLQI
jgi:hypothetical protein